MDAPDIIFRIEGFTPETLPMSRLAEYLSALARLLGEKERVHFVAIEEGSACLVARPEPQVAPKVHQRIASAQRGDDEEINGIVAALNRMLANDNTAGELRESGPAGVVLRFPGADARGAELGPVVEEGAIQGELVSVGGRDRTAHATLRDGDRTYHCEMSRDLARAMGPYLYGPPLRVTGRGTWRRTREGKWEVVRFRAASFEQLEAVSLIEAVRRLREAGGFGLRDAAEVDRRLRELRAD